MTTLSTRKLSETPSLAVLAAERIERGILMGDYAPGQRLTEEFLCAELGVSRPPVREALQSLARMGLVEHQPRRGVRVTPLTQHDVYEIVTLRKELELMALRLALPTLRPDRVQRCYDRLADMEEIIETGDEAAMIAGGFAFHIALVGLAGHSRIEDTYHRMAMQLQLCMAMNNQARRTIEDLEGNVQRHRDLLAAVLTGDVELASTALRNHGDGTFLLEVVDTLTGATQESQAWLKQLRADYTVPPPQTT
ncbi:GntR family transcriptional regulator [Ornithinimicrobium sp. W1679]|uniref:GntR family transcriptional regulator n=1 Tax=Ornithinimicrobium sp. W1679 TaxID=3418770 RepID=UPI003CF3D861